MALEDYFTSKPIEIIKNPAISKEQETPQGMPETQEQLENNQEREKRTIFVGNVPLESSQKKIKQFFQKFGEIDKVYIRSLPVDSEVKLGLRAKILSKSFTEGSNTANAFVVFKEISSIEKVLQEKKDLIFEGRHLRVSKANHKDLDYKTTLFVGNLPFVTDEEEVREHFQTFGTVDLVRIIRDKVTHKTKGFCYVKFENKDGFMNALKSNKKFKDNQLRLSKAKKHVKEDKTVKKVNKEGALRRLNKKKKN